MYGDVGVFFFEFLVGLFGSGDFGVCGFGVYWYVVGVFVVFLDWCDVGFDLVEVVVFVVVFD